MSKPTFLCVWHTLTEISKVWAENVTETVSVICLERTWVFMYASQRNEVSCPAWHSCHLSEEFSSADSVSTVVTTAYYCCVKGWLGVGVCFYFYLFILTYVKPVNGWAALCFLGMCIRQLIFQHQIIHVINLFTIRKPTQSIGVGGVL